MIGNSSPLQYRDHFCRKQLDAFGDFGGRFPADVDLADKADRTGHLHEYAQFVHHLLHTARDQTETPSTMG